MTILGMWTVGELIDLLKAKDYQVAETSKGYANFSPTWVNKDSNAFVDWTNDWNAFQDRYNAAHQRATIVIDANKLSPVPASSTPADADYKAVLSALKQVDGTITKGDIDDLIARLRAAGGLVDESQTPQPSSPDVDLNTMNALPKVPTPKTLGAGIVIAGIVGGLVALRIIFR